MKICRLLAAAAVAAAGIVVTPGVAFASGESVGSCFAEEFESITGGAALEDLSDEQLEEVEAAADECVEAPSPVLPEVNEIIWGGLFFSVVAFLLIKFAFPALRETMHAREERIRSELEGAERARTDAESELAGYQAQLADARSESGRIVEEARQSADQVRRELIAKAEEDAAAVRSRADEDIVLAKERAISELRAEVGTMSIELAEKVVERNLDRDTQMALIDSYIRQVGGESTN